MQTTPEREALITTITLAMDPRFDVPLAERIADRLIAQGIAYPSRQPGSAVDRYLMLDLQAHPEMTLEEFHERHGISYY